MHGSEIFTSLRGSYTAWTCIALFLLVCFFVRKRLAERVADGLTQAVTTIAQLVLLFFLLYLLYTLDVLPLDDL